MPPRSWAVRFAVRLAVAYCVLIAPWPGIDHAFGAAYRATGNGVSRLLGLCDYVEMGVPAVVVPRGDVEIIATNPQTGRRLRIEHGSRDWAYLPLAAGLSLVLAIPAPWPRRLRALGVLLVCISFFVLMRVALASFYGLAALQVFSFSSQALDAIGKLMVGFCATPIASYVVPVIVWLVVLCRYHELLGFFSNDAVPMQEKSGPRS